MKRNRAKGNDLMMKAKREYFENGAEEEAANLGEPQGVSRRRGREHGQIVPSKRIRSFSRGDDDYCPGNIVNIELRHFMTYDYIQTTPGPRLNLVIGPNGTGKSSLVCAICIGLAGEPKLLGRAGLIGDYVQRGQQEGSIKIALRGETPAEKIEILRKINTANKTEWFLNGTSCKKEDIKDLAKKLNIQVGNLTQFLPQDRVCEFAKLSPVDLLKETQLAVGDPELHEQHLYLINKKGDLQTLETTVNQNTEALETLKAENADVEKDVERMQGRTQLLEKAELMKKKVPWLLYDKLKKDFILARDEAKTAKKEADEAHRNSTQHQVPLQEALGRKAAIAKKMQKLNLDFSRMEQLHTNLVKEEEDLVNVIHGKEVEIEQMHRQAEVHLAKFEKAKGDYRNAQAEFEKFQLEEPSKERLKEISVELDKLRGKMYHLEDEEKKKKYAIKQENDEIQRVRRKLDEIESRTAKIIHALNQQDRSVQTSVDWLRENKHRLKGPVYGPVATEVQVADPQHAAYLEQHVRSWVWKAFIATNNEDRDLLMRNIDSDVTSCPDVSRDYPPPHISEQARALGITHRLDTVFDAPPVVRQVLCSQANIQTSYIGTVEAAKNADAISQHCKIDDFWTPQVHFHWSRSRYHGSLTGVTRTPRTAQIFKPGMGQKEFAELQQKGGQLEIEVRRLEQELQQVQQSLTEVEIATARLERERDSMIHKYNQQKKQKKQLQGNVERCKRLVDSLEKMQDPAREQEKLRQEISALNTKRFSLAMKVHSLLIKIGNEQLGSAQLLLSRVEQDGQVSILEQACKESSDAAKLALARHAALDQKALQLKEELRKALEAAKRVFDLGAHPEMQLVFEEFPETVEDLQAAIHDTMAEANNILCPNPHVVEEYEKRGKRIMEIEEQLQQSVASLEELRGDIESVKGKWLPRLQELVAKINETFGRNFAEMAVAGEVALDERGMEFDKYGILIKVKFREAGELQLLSAHHQSGGERSVSTILFLVSLQAITQCPFRVVDEINQGMDPNNERKMFQQLVRAASLPNTPQSFLLTPKLLSDLDYGESCSVLNIMNGPFVSDVAKHGFKQGLSFSTALQSLAAEVDS